MGSDNQETYMDTNSPLDILSDVSIDRNINIHTSKKPISHSDSDMHVKSLSGTGKMTVHTHSEGDETFTDVVKHLAARETEVHTDMGIKSDDMSTDKHLNSHVASDTRGQHINTDMSTHNLDPSPETNTHTTTHTETHVDTQVSHSNTNYHTDKNTSKHTNRSCCTDVHALTTIQNWASICINSQNNPNHTLPTASANTYAVTPNDLYNTQNDTPFNNTYTHSDTHFFLYYLSQYFNLVSSVLFYLSAAVNPLLYNLMSARYRHAVHSLIRSHSNTQSHRLHTLTARHSTTTI